MSEAKKVVTNAKRAALLKEAWADISLEVEGAKLIAEIRRIHFDAYKAKGFTDEQALVLCQNRTI